MSRPKRVVYDKDAVDNCYTDDLVMALASAGRIVLEGMTTSSSVAPHNHLATSKDYEGFVRDRAEGVKIARASGFENLPDPVRGAKGYIEIPSSRRIEDTVPLDAEGTRLVLELAKRSTPSDPLILLMCAHLTLAADAYLLEPSIADRIVVHWFGGSLRGLDDYNGWGDPWAAYIVLRRLRLLQYPAFKRGSEKDTSPYVTKDRLATLPNTPLREWMIQKAHNEDQPGDRDYDAPPAIGLVRKDYVERVKRVVSSGWVSGSGRDLPAFRRAPWGRARVVARANGRVANEEWWRALSDPMAYHGATAG